MRGFSFLLATTLTLGYFFAAQAAMKAHRAEVVKPVPATPALTEDAARVWYGGTLAPVIVEASAQPKCMI
jgi:hypothetical protein